MRTQATIAFAAAVASDGVVPFSDPVPIAMTAATIAAADANTDDRARRNYDESENDAAIDA